MSAKLMSHLCQSIAKNLAEFVKVIAAENMFILKKRITRSFKFIIRKESKDFN